MKQPSFFIVGAPKCGTTALCKYLNRHPDIFVPTIKEIKYFDKDLKNQQRTKNLDDYLRFFEEGKGKVCGEGSPSYLRSQVAAREIHAFNSNAKIIIMLREPVSLLYSIHSQRLFNGASEDIEDFQLALAAEAERRQGKRIPKKCKNPEKLFYRSVVNFTEQIERYFNFFGRDNVHIIIFDDFQKDTAQVYQDTLRFLGVNPNFETHFNKINANRKVRNQFLKSLIDCPPEKILKFGKFFIPLSQAQRRAILENVKFKLKHLNKEKTTRPPLNPEFERSLKQEFAPEIERLSRLLGRDLTHWSRD
ncbi:MAG: sulfotransferase [Cyanobacteriota bacterium]|nr:sulfotransferase [Cyanobacteriota bacterium]